MIRAIVSLLVSVFAAVQVALIFLRGEGLCLDEGCRIVDALTTVPPLYFNVAGAFFFLTLSLGFYKGRNDSELWENFTGMLLLAGIAAEGVLIFFQHSVVTVYCSYCLIIFSSVLLLNILSGLRQCFYAAVIFTAVIVAFASLQFKAASSAQSLDAGSIAQVSGSKDGDNIYLFFSSSCSYCEEIIATMREKNTCTIRFNPIEKIKFFDFPDVEQFTDYDPEVNLDFLKSLSLDKVPICVAKGSKGIRIFSGERQIKHYLDENCRDTNSGDYSGTGSGKISDESFLSFQQEGADDKCSVAEDCLEVQEQTSNGME